MMLSAVQKMLKFHVIYKTARRYRSCNMSIICSRKMCWIVQTNVSCFSYQKFSILHTRSRISDRMRREIENFNWTFLHRNLTWLKFLAKLAKQSDLHALRRSTQQLKKHKKNIFENKRKIENLKLSNEMWMETEERSMKTFKISQFWTSERSTRELLDRIKQMRWDLELISMMERLNTTQ